MLTIIAFILTILGTINWFLIGLLQYDFVAGIFGFQASILSRLIYIIVGISGIFLVFKLFKGKGTIAVFSRRNKKDLQKNLEKIGQPKEQTNVEASKENYKEDSFNDMKKNEEYSQNDENQSIFDENIK